MARIEENARQTRQSRERKQNTYLCPDSFRGSRLFVCLVGNNRRRSKLQTETKEIIPMNTLIKTSIGRSFLRRGFILIPLVLMICFAFMQKAQAAELDILPNGNTAYGNGVLV